MMQGSIIRTPTETRESRFNSTLSPARGTTKRSTASRPKYSTDSRTPARALPDRKNSSRHSAVAAASAPVPT